MNWHAAKVYLDWLKRPIVQPTKPTAEQQIAIEHALRGESFKVVAYAGTGKTTTLQMISAAMPERRGMYLALTKPLPVKPNKSFTAMSTAALFTRLPTVACRATLPTNCVYLA